MSEELAHRVKWDAQGLVAAVAQDARSGRVQMVAWMNQEALTTTLRTRRATFFSRSRGRLWIKGETSGHHLEIASVHLDCDGDTVLLRVHPRGPSCHTGATTCFFTPLEPKSKAAASESAGESAGEPAREPAGEPASDRPIETGGDAPTLVLLETDIAARTASDAGKSYTRSLLDRGVGVIGDKLREEADELARAIASETEARVASEAADVMYHLMVALAARGVSFDSVLAVLDARRGVSGHDEKRKRTP